MDAAGAQTLLRLLEPLLSTPRLRIDDQHSAPCSTFQFTVAFRLWRIGAFLGLGHRRLSLCRPLPVWGTLIGTVCYHQIRRTKNIVSIYGGVWVMIVVMAAHATEEEIKDVEQRIQDWGYGVHPIYGAERTVIGAV